MIKISDLYNVLSAVVPLYVAMILAYSSVKWWKIFTPDQCSGINRFVALFAVPLLSFHYIASNNPFTMNFRFLAADSVAKLMVLAILLLWVKFSRNGSLDWMITLFSLATLPNTLVMGIPLLKAMYGDFSGELMVQIVVFQCIIWYTLLLFLFEYRGARNLIADNLPEAAPSIVSFKVESDVVSLDGRQPLQTQAEIRCDGKIHVTIRKSTSSVISSRRSHGLASMPSSKALTPRPSNMTGAEIYSLPSSRNPTPRGSSFNHSDFYSMLAGGGRGFISPRHSNFAPSDVGGFYTASGRATPRTSNFDDDVNSPRFPSLYPPAATAAYIYAAARGHDRPSHFENQVPYTMPKSSLSHGGHPPDLLSPNVATSMTPGSGARCLGAPVAGHYAACPGAGPMSPKTAATNKGQPVASKAHQDPKKEDANKELHMFVWSSSASPVSEGGLHFFGGRTDFPAIDGPRPDQNSKDVRMLVLPTTENAATGGLPEPREHFEEYAREDFSFGNRAMSHDEGSLPHDINGPTLSKFGSNSTADLTAKLRRHGKPVAMPPTRVMTKLILVMVWRKLIRNPNTYSSLLGVIWSLISARWHIMMPAIVSKSISILSDAGLGMAMFSLGLFMALQPKIIACGNSVAAFGMAVRFLTGPAVMAAASIAVGIRGVLLHVAIVQAALPQGIVPFVFAKEYNVHPDILSTGVIFGMLIALPITVFYYFLLGL